MKIDKLRVVPLPGYRLDKGAGYLLVIWLEDPTWNVLLEPGMVEESIAELMEDVKHYGRPHPDRTDLHYHGLGVFWTVEATS